MREDPTPAARAGAQGARNHETLQRSWSLITGDDVYLLNEGTHNRLYLKLGAHPLPKGNSEGTYFAVWAPNAERVSVIGDFNAWRPGADRLNPRAASGIWEGFVPGVMPGATYKYHIESRFNGYAVDKADPFAFATELPPHTASVVADLAYGWGDAAWMAGRRRHNSLTAPMAVYEVHLGSWMRDPASSDRFLTYRELAPRLVEYVTRLGFTHVEFLPIMEHPFYGSWGYQTAAYFAPSRRYGAPQDLMHLIDQLHQAGIGVFLDWVPSHFPADEHGLGYFDGTHLFEHADQRQGYHPDWKSLIFNYGRNEVRAFLTSSATFWLDLYHADGLRVDAVASMLYLDYSRRAGEWIPNEYGGNENLPAIAFMRRLNEDIYRSFPDVQMIAEESTAWPMVSKPNYVGGLGFGLKWDMGWMHDSLEYMSKDPVHRKYQHSRLTFRMLYAFSENFVLPLSHDEVVHGKGSLLARMPGDDWQKFANLRLLLGYMYGQPAKKLLFMGGEFGQRAEWNHDSSLEWRLLQYEPHQGVQRWVQDLNRMYRTVPAMHLLDADHAGFEWIDPNDHEQSVLTFLRQGGPAAHPVVVVCNFTPVPRHNYRVGVPKAGLWKELLNGDAREYGGSGQGNFGGAEAAPVPYHGRPYSLTITAPPLAAAFFRPDGGER